MEQVLRSSSGLMLDRWNNLHAAFILGVVPRPVIGDRIEIPPALVVLHKAVRTTDQRSALSSLAKSRRK